MLKLTENSSIILSLPVSNSHPLVKNNGRKSGITLARKRTDLSENSKSSLKLNPNITLTRAAIAVLGLGFIDAGYSGDWSRIGVISKEAEDLLKIAAFLVVPLCVFLILSFSRDPDAE